MAERSDRIWQDAGLVAVRDLAELGAIAGAVAAEELIDKAEAEDTGLS